MEEVNVRACLKVSTAFDDTSLLTVDDPWGIFNLAAQAPPQYIYKILLFLYKLLMTLLLNFFIITDNAKAETVVN